MQRSKDPGRAVAAPPILTRIAASRLAAWSLLALLALGARGADAAEYCVGTRAELDAALDEAASPSQALFTTTIRLRQGTYNLGGSRFTQPGQRNFHALELLGGHNGDCSARTVNPDNTIFDAGGAAFFRFEPLGDLSIEGIRFQNLSNARLVDIASAADDLTVRVRNNAFVGVGVFVVAGNDPEGDPVDGLSLRFLSNRVHGYPGFASSPAVRMAALTQIRFTGNTIADNQGNDAVELCRNGSDVWLVDNIVWNNAGDDLRVYEDCDEAETGVARSRSNLYQSAVLTPIGDSGDNLVGTDPLFVNAAGGNYRLQNASPAVNSGVVSSSMADLDLAGNPRVVGSTVDRGGYESAVNDTIPVTLTVTTTSDSGAGSLRQAILDANANADFNFITFDIPGGCPQVIAPGASDLPAIVNGVSIDGYTQPGSISNTRSKGDNATRCIVLSGNTGRAWGLNFAGADDEQFLVQGLAFSGFNPPSGTGVALRIAGGTGNLVRGNQFGATLSSNAGALVLSPSDINIELTGDSTSTVGGEATAHRNVIADAGDYGVLISSFTLLSVVFASTQNDIVDNLFGSYGLELTAAGNQVAIKVNTDRNTIRENTIINSNSDGVLMDVATAHTNLIQANRIGRRDVICLGTLCFGGPAGNGRHGVHLFFGPHDNLLMNNTIQNNTADGVSIGSSSGATSLRNWLFRNSFYNNGGRATAFNVYNGADNDADPAQQNMANRGLNFPLLSGAGGDPQQGSVQGTLTTTNGIYAIEVFSSAEPDAGFPRGEAQQFHASATVVVSNATPGQNGTASFDIPFSSSTDLGGRAITVTATDAAGNSSELSAPVIYASSGGSVFADGFED